MSGNNLDSIFEPGSHIICRRNLDEQGSILYLNSAVKKLLGYAPVDCLPPSREGFYSFVHPDDQANVRQNIASLIKGKSSLNHSFRMLHAQGHIVQVHEQGELVQVNEQETILESVIVALSGNSSTQILQMYKSMANASQEAMLIHKKGVIIHANSTFSSLFGYNINELIDREFSDLLFSPNHPFEQATQEYNLSAGQRIVMINKSGARLLLRIREERLQDPLADMQLLIFTMISDKVEEYQNLIDLQKKYLALIEDSQDGIFLHDNGVIVEANKKIQEITGYSKEELIGAHLKSMVPEEELPKVIQHLQEVNQDPTLFQQRTYKILQKRGTHTSIQVWGNSIRLQNKDYRYVIVRDVSEMIRDKEELEQSRKKYKRLSEITEEIILIHDNGTVVEANRAACAHFGKTEQEIIGMHTFDLTPDYIKEEYGLTKELLESSYLSDESVSGIQFTEKDGEQQIHKYTEYVFKENGNRLHYAILTNITQEYKTQKQLEESTLKYKLFADASNEAISIHRKGKLKEANRAYRDLFKIKDEEVEGFLTSKVMVPEYQAINALLTEITETILTNLNPAEYDSLEAIEQAYYIVLRDQLREREIQLPFQRGENGAVILPLQDSQGNKFTAESRSRIILIDGEIYQFQIIRDITKTLQAQRELEDSRNKYKLLADITREAIVIQTLEGLIVEVNDAYCKLLKVSEEEIIGQTGLDFVPPHLLNQMVIRLRQSAQYVTKENYKKTPPSLDHFQLQDAQGNLFDAEISTNYILVNDQLMRYMIIRDISDIIGVQRQLQESTAKYKRLANATQEGIIIHQNGIIKEVNQKACQLFEWTEEELIGQNLRELAEGDTLNLIMQELRNNNGSNDKIDQEDVERVLLRKSNGDTFIAELWESTIRVDGYNYQYTVVRDITQRIRYENQIEELIYNLSEKNKQLNCLFDLAKIASNKSYSLDELMEKALEILPEGWQHPEICYAAISFRQKTWESQNFEMTPWQMNAPIYIDGQNVGSVTVGYLEDSIPADEGPFLSTERTLIDALGIQIGTLIEKRLSEDRVIATVLETEDRERTRIAKELHDSLGQLLTAISLNLESLKKDMDNLSEKNQTKLSNALNYLADAIRESRSLSHNLMPKAINDYGYVLAVQSMMEGLQAVEEVNFDFFDNLKGERLHPKMELALFRITQEAITNILKHANAKNITIQLMKYSDVIILTIEDDGSGFQQKEILEGPKTNFGLNSMRNRANSISGVLTIESKQGHGTTIMVEVPL